MNSIAKLIVEKQNIGEKMEKEGFRLSSILENKHIECVSRACLMGLSTGCISFATLYLGQRHFTRQLKGMKMSTILLSSTFFACVTGYLIVDAKLIDCNKSLRRHAASQT